MGQYVYTALCMTMILDSEKLNPQYNQNSVLTVPWIAWGEGGPGTHRRTPLATGLYTPLRYSVILVMKIYLVLLLV